MGSSIKRIVTEPGKVKRSASDTLQYLEDAEKKSENLTDLLYPSVDGGLRDIHRGGWDLPLNQQWGSHLMPLPDGSWGDTATGHIAETDGYVFGYNASNAFVSQSFKVSKGCTIDSIFVKIKKYGNPTANAVLAIYSDSSGVPGSVITNGTAVAQAGTLHSGNFKWEKFTFSTPPTLSANTLYHIVLGSSAAVDSSNYWAWASASSTGKYPLGNACYANSSYSWSTVAAADNCFMVVPTTTNQFLQTGGQFSGELHFTQGSPLNQSDYLTRPLKDFFDAKSFTYYGLWEALTKDKTFLDCMYGLDHDRIVVRCNVTTGYVQVDLYESDGTKHTVTGTTDVSSGVHQIGIKARMMNDGSDYLYLYIDGASEGIPVTSASVLMDSNFKELGTATVGGGFPVAPTWTKETLMGSLPGSDGWTYNGTATEASHFVINSGKLYQQWVGATDTSYYSISPTLNNANGHTTTWKARVLKAGDTLSESEGVVKVLDGTKIFYVAMHTYYIDTLASIFGGTAIKFQIDLTQADHVFMISVKGSDGYLWIDGKLVIDATGKVDQTSATNKIDFGDYDGTSGSNAEVIWDYVKYYNTAAILPEYTSGILHEQAFWSGDQSALFPVLYNGGSFISAKEYCGVKENYVSRKRRCQEFLPITAAPQTTSTSPVLLTDMAGFMFSDDFNVESSASLRNEINGTGVYYDIYDNGISTSLRYAEFTTGGFAYEVSNMRMIKGVFQLHRSELRWYVSGGTGTSIDKRRSVKMEEI